MRRGLWELRIVGVRSVFWNLVGGLVIHGRGGCDTWSLLECTRRACGAWAFGRK